jgi:hypothetical protein
VIFYFVQHSSREALAIFRCIGQAVIFAYVKLKTGLNLDTRPRALSHCR